MCIVGRGSRCPRLMAVCGTHRVACAPWRRVPVPAGLEHRAGTGNKRPCIGSAAGRSDRREQVARLVPVQFCAAHRFVSEGMTAGGTSGIAIDPARSAVPGGPRRQFPHSSDHWFRSVYPKHDRAQVRFDRPSMGRTPVAPGGPAYRDHDGIGRGGAVCTRRPGRGA